MASRKEVENLHLHKSDGLCELAEILGYRQTGRFAINQLQCANGAFVSSLCHFFDDNPGAMEAVRDWILQECDLEEDVDEEEEEEETVSQSEIAAHMSKL